MIRVVIHMTHDLIHMIYVVVRMTHDVIHMIYVVIRMTHVVIHVIYVVIRISLYRWYARKILLSISEHPEFESMLAKYTTSTDFREVKQIVENLRLKGLGGIPNDTPSATGARRTGTMTRGSRTNSAESNVSGASR